MGQNVELKQEVEKCVSLLFLMVYFVPSESFFACLHCLPVIILQSFLLKIFLDISTKEGRCQLISGYVNTTSEKGD